MELAEKLAQAVMADLRGRQGILDDVEPDMQEEIQTDLEIKVHGILLDEGAVR